MTQTAKHTPGPWIDNGQGIICSREGDVCTNVNNSSDAKLIAAAPDMAEALKIAIDGFTYGKSKQGIHNNSKNAETIRAALAKAGVQ